MKLGDQFAHIIRDVVARDALAISENAMEGLQKDMNSRMDKGADVTNSLFKAYKPITVKDRGRLGLSPDSTPVTFQRLLERIKKSVITRVDGDTVKLSWDGQGAGSKSFGSVLYYHQKGMGKNPPRKILPEVDSEFPKHVTKEVHRKAKELLNVKL